MRPFVGLQGVVPSGGTAGANEAIGHGGWASHRAQLDGFQLQTSARRQNDRAFEDVFQFAHVAGPVVVDQPVEDGRRECDHFPTQLTRLAGDQIGGEQRDILASLAQRGDVDGEDRETMVEITAKPSFAHGLFEIAVARRDNPHVGFQGPSAPHPLELAELQHTEHLCLRIQR